jgi:hypothetical protein
MKHDARKAGPGGAAAQPTDRSISSIEVRDLRRPEAVVSYPLGENQRVRLAGTVVIRIVLQPGWNWRQVTRRLVTGMLGVPCRVGLLKQNPVQPADVGSASKSGDHEPLECLHADRRFHARTTGSGGLIRPLLPDGVVLAGEEGFEPSIS